MKKHNLLYTKNTKGKFLFLRHGETNYNKDSAKIKQSVIKINVKYLDCPLNEKGIQQAKLASENIKNIKFEAIYVSPLRRALETANILFTNHPQKNQLKIIVHPGITEIVAGVHNLIPSIKESKQIFNLNSDVKFDWSVFDSINKDDFSRDTYFLSYIDSLPSDKFNDIIQNMKINYNTDNYINSLVEIPKLFLSLNLPRAESLNHAFKRGLSFKSFLKSNFKDTINNVNNKVLVITHSAIMKLLTSNSILTVNNIQKYPNDCHILNNCEIISIYP